jgi:hypothetical protein
MIGFEIEPALSGDYLYLEPLNAEALLTYEIRKNRGALQG